MITVYGASDDLIEVEGDISEEFYAFNDEDANYLAFSDGTVLSVKYDDDGMWRINRVCDGAATYSKTEATDADDNYSDKVQLLGVRHTWVVHGKEMVKAKK